MCTSTQLLSYYRTPEAKYVDRSICLNRPAAEARAARAARLREARAAPDRAPAVLL
eukprot:COSAG06_NODE_57631_length_279_cov_1.888889_1_plen_55_part_10